MSIVCVICQKKQSGWIQDYPLSEDHKYLRICSNCFEKLNTIINNDSPENVDAAKDYFNKIFLSVNVWDEAKTVVNEAIASQENAQDREAKEKEREKKEIEVAQQLEKKRQDDLERIRIIDEERLRREREEQHRVQLDRLKSQGIDGYYEYKVVSFSDISGLFSKDSGRVNTIAMTEALNLLGMDGWHLVTAYSNELGKNAFSGGVGSAILGVNSTVDENILIFERFVRI